MSVFIELGVFIIAKQGNRWVITCSVASLWRGVAHIKELVLIQTCKKEDKESLGQWVISICHNLLGCNPRGLCNGLKM